MTRDPSAFATNADLDRIRADLTTIIGDAGHLSEEVAANIVAAIEPCVTRADLAQTLVDLERRMTLSHAGELAPAVNVMVDHFERAFGVAALTPTARSAGRSRT